MSNRIKKRDSNFTQVSNSFLRDNNISFKAKGLFCYMFSMNENWNFTIKSIASQQMDGEASIISAMNELKKFSYIIYTKHTDGSGTYFLNDEPNVEKPNLENPNLGKSTPIKNIELIKNKNTYSNDFEILYDYYKKNTGRPVGDKKKAYESFKKISKEIEYKKIKLSVYNYLIECKKAQTFTKHLVSFLNSDISIYIREVDKNIDSSSKNQSRREEILI